MSWFELKKYCRTCNVNNLWALEEDGPTLDSDFICPSCKRIQMSLDHKKNVIVHGHCSDCNFYNFFEMDNGVPMLLASFACRHCNWIDIMFGRVMKKTVIDSDTSNYQRDHLTKY